jgi:putative heme iron utilization protein
MQKDLIIVKGWCTTDGHVRWSECKVVRFHPPEFNSEDCHDVTYFLEEGEKWDDVYERFYTAM